MKKLFFAAVIVAFSIAGTKAQTFGAKAGLNLANVTGDVSDNSMLTAFHVGVVADFEISDEFSFQPELVYSMQGTKISVLGTDFNVNFNYLNLPLLAKYEVAEGISVLAGPQIGFLMTAENDGTDIKDNYKGVDFGFDLGAAYELESGMFFDLRYNIGLSNMVDDNSNESLKNAVISFSLGYKFN